jgi:hypothetical protein
MPGKDNCHVQTNDGRTHPATRPGSDPRTAVAPLIKIAENVEIARWMEFLNSLLLFLLVPCDPESGAIYVLDRKQGTWYSVDFEDEQGGYGVSQSELLLKDSWSLRHQPIHSTVQMGCHRSFGKLRARVAVRRRFDSDHSDHRFVKAIYEELCRNLLGKASFPSNPNIGEASELSK